MTIHLISVGKSILDAFDRPDKALRKQLGQEFVQAFRDARPGTILGQPGDLPAAASTLLSEWFGPGGTVCVDVQRCVENVRPSLWPAAMCAELETFGRLHDRRTALVGNETGILLATDTLAGLTAATWVAVALADGDLSRVRYVASPDDTTKDQLAQLNRPAAVVVLVPGLDASTDEGFRTAMRGVGILGRALLPGPGQRPEEFHVHLSGGFKAAIPYLIGLAEGLRSLPSEKVSAVHAWVLHDTTTTRPIRLPLRRFSAQRIRDELKGFSASGEGPAPSVFHSLEGYAYEKTGGSTYRITAFGEGLRVLIGVQHEPLGG